MGLFDKDQYKTGSDVKINEVIDKNLKEDTVLPMGENEVSYGELKSLYPINNQERINCLIYWDDIMQYTTFALIEIINSMLNIDTTDEMIDFKSFVSRPNDYSNGMTYVFKLYEKILTKEKIIEIRDKVYWKMLQLSLKSNMYISIQKTATFMQSIGFWFPCTFNNCESLKLGLKQLLMTDKNTDAIKFHYGNVESFHDAFKSGNYNAIITPNIQSTYNFIIKNDIKRIDIIGPEAHNGINEETYDLFQKYAGLPLPQYCSLSFYKEMIYKS